MTCLVTGNLTYIGWAKMEALGIKQLFSEPYFGGFGSDFCSGNLTDTWKDRAELVRIAAKKASKIQPGMFAFCTLLLLPASPGHIWCRRLARCNQACLASCAVQLMTGRKVQRLIVSGGEGGGGGGLLRIKRGCKLSLQMMSSASYTVKRLKASPVALKIV